MPHEVYQRFVSSRDALESSLITSGKEGKALTQDREKIVSLKPLELLGQLKRGTVTVVQTLEAFQAKAIEQSKKTNCVTLFLTTSKALAEKLDAERSSTNFQEKPLFGLPMSIKENIFVKGTDSTIGLEKLVGKPAEKDANLVDIFKKLGAVPFVKTNVPQLCMSYSCGNPIYGDTTNPHSTDRGPGGSSGGEGALIGGGGSLLGLGADIGGSVRIPANSCGIYSIRPTARRIPNGGTADDIPGLFGVYNTLGIMGISGEIVALATKALMSQDLLEYNADLPPIPWRENIERPLKKVLRIGWYDSLDIIPSTPGVRRAVAESLETVKSLGHEVVAMRSPNGLQAFQLWNDFAFLDRGAGLKIVLEGETEHECCFFSKVLTSVPAELRELAKPFIRHQHGDIVADITCTIEKPGDIWKKQIERSEYLQNFISSWRNQNLDLMICPVAPMPAPPVGFDENMIITAIYTMIYNLLDFPCCAVPVTKESPEDQKLLREYPEDSKVLRLIKEYTKGSVGLPNGVQFVALPYQEELLCRIMREYSSKH